MNQFTQLPRPSVGYHAETDQIETILSGKEILEDPLLNKSSAFSLEERRTLGIIGMLPQSVTTIEEQLTRTYENYLRKDSDIERYIHLASLHDRNETLFYRLLIEHIAEMTPVVYTPVVGEACQKYSHIFRRTRGLYIAYPDREHIAEILANPAFEQTKIAVVTDGERILGLGDQGADGMGIPVGKLALYTLCAGIYPSWTLPITLDTGTDNPDKLNDPMYLGWRHARVRGKEYDDFVEQFAQAFQRQFPNAILQWEDFSKQNARRILNTFRGKMCTFNDDIQGTGAVTLAAAAAAVKYLGQKMSDQRIVLLGAGSANVGIAHQFVSMMRQEGMSESAAIARIWMLNSKGLIHTGLSGVEPEQLYFARPAQELAAAGIDISQPIDLETAVHNAVPTILIGASAQPNAFTRSIIQFIAAHVERPMIFPLSNPTSKSEAHPQDLITWTNGKALIATGSPYAPAQWNHTETVIGQCNNMFVFPGVGLGVMAVEAKTITDSMFLAAALALRDLAPILSSPTGALLPDVAEARAVARSVALAVAKQAQTDGATDILLTNEQAAKRIDSLMWYPHYPKIHVQSSLEQASPGEKRHGWRRIIFRQN